MLTITLDESDCFAAWVSAKDAGFSSPDGSDPKRESVLPSPPPCEREGGSVLPPCAHLSKSLFCCVDDVFGQDFPKSVCNMYPMYTNTVLVASYEIAF